MGAVPPFSESSRPVEAPNRMRSDESVKRKQSEELHHDAIGVLEDIDQNIQCADADEKGIIILSNYIYKYLQPPSTG